MIGDDVGGLAVHIGARVMGEAGPGEVLVSSTVKDLVVGSGIEFEERGARELKGVPGEWRLFVVKDCRYLTDAGGQDRYLPMRSMLVSPVRRPSFSSCP